MTDSLIIDAAPAPALLLLPCCGQLASAVGTGLVTSDPAKVTCLGAVVAGMSREELHARIADVLRRSGVADAEALVRAMEVDHAAIRTALAAGLYWSDQISRGEVRRTSRSRARAAQDATLIGDALSGLEIGPPKPASEAKPKKARCRRCGDEAFWSERISGYDCDSCGFTFSAAASVESEPE